MRMIEDLAHEAFRAARAGDAAGAGRAVDTIARCSENVVDTAVRLWIDRVLVLLGDRHAAGVRITVNMVADESGDGVPTPLDRLRTELAWVGNLFAAHAGGDVAAWHQLRASVPAGKLPGHLYLMLTTMARTSLAYEEDHEPARCCGIHAWITADPAATGELVAHAHLN